MALLDDADHFHGVVYLITNAVNGKGYVGKTDGGDIYYRWRQHVVASKLYPDRMPIAAAIRKYGPEHFHMAVLGEAASSQSLCDMECRFIALLGTKDPRIGYNCTDGGEGIVGLARSPQHLEKLSQRAKERWANPEWAARTRELMRGRSLSPEHRAKLSQLWKGRKRVTGFKHSAETIAKMREITRLRWQNTEYRKLVTEKHIGHKVSDETRQKMATRVLNSDPEYRKKMSETITEWWRKRKAQNA